MSKCTILGVSKVKLKVQSHILTNGHNKYLYIKQHKMYRLLTIKHIKKQILTSPSLSHQD